MTDGYRGVFGAYPFAFRESDSLLFRSYVVVGGLLAAGTAILFALGLVVLLAKTALVPGGTLTLSRSFYAVLGLFVVVPLVAPVLFVARRHRRGEARDDDAYDPALALSGYLFALSLYVGLVATVPPAQQTTPTGVFAPAVRVLYGLPQFSGLVPPLVAGALIYLVHRVVR
ncbi:MAG: hypothetical protein ABEJ82_03730 [Haloplanus sp.]